ncbi:hypothetical protein CHLRE_10g464300v5 [Chlamydomonas reinhardtii]|uniref:Uncharacterized protein n=1 Tax=Chlamydomonas reinhardtii TaxID=3055 RepID=A0A2K3DC51_CHLRE|nr:uncharacterized protein CHLRE_10g464300v5 [Chlamydomonas reinhardtii]PNW78102.1 hypothetical protein CHLRE_10g464300v5 [Chlamydomonas reinhardtii]
MRLPCRSHGVRARRLAWAWRARQESMSFWLFCGSGTCSGAAILRIRTRGRPGDAPVPVTPLHNLVEPDDWAQWVLPAAKGAGGPTSHGWVHALRDAVEDKPDDDEMMPDLTPTALDAAAAAARRAAPKRSREQEQAAAAAGEAALALAIRESEAAKQALAAAAAVQAAATAAAAAAAAGAAGTPAAAEAGAAATAAAAAGASGTVTAVEATAAAGVEAASPPAAPVSTAGVGGIVGPAALPAGWSGGGGVGNEGLAGGVGQGLLVEAEAALGVNAKLQCQGRRGGPATSWTLARSPRPGAGSSNAAAEAGRSWAPTLAGGVV